MKLRDYQEYAVQSIFDYFEEGKSGNPVIAMPTGTGKSLVIAGFIQRVLSMWANQRFMVLTHVKELITQNSEKLRTIWPNAPMGIYSSGLNQKDIAQAVIMGGVGSVVNVVEAFGHRDLVIIDEAHLVSPKDSTMYQNVIQRLKVINPHLKLIGLTATPWRLGQGMITDDGLFTDICCDLTGVNAFNRLIAEGYICPLIPKRTNIEIDCSEVGINNGDYAKGELDEATDKVLYEALKELVEQGYDRKSWLIFASGIKSTEHSAEILQSFGISAAAVHSKIPSKERDRRLESFKNGELRVLCGNNIFTTGFDHPPVDLIGMLRPTISPGLWVQMLGRGTRPFNDKSNCLVLDFAGNTRRLGPINDPVKPRKKGEKQGEAPIRICDSCGVYNHASARHCCSCGMEFTFKTKLVSHAATDSLLRSDAPIIEYFNVDRVIYHRHEKEGAPPSIKVSYYSGLRMFNEWVCFEHSGFVKKKARDWWRQRHAIEPPETTNEALKYVSELNVPKRIRVWVNRKYPEVLACEW